MRDGHHSALHETRCSTGCVATPPLPMRQGGVETFWMARPLNRRVFSIIHYRCWSIEQPRAMRAGFPEIISLGNSRVDLPQPRCLPPLSLAFSPASVGSWKRPSPSPNYKRHERKTKGAQRGGAWKTRKPYRHRRVHSPRISDRRHVWDPRGSGGIAEGLGAVSSPGRQSVSRQLQGSARTVERGEARHEEENTLYGEEVV